MAVGMNVNPDLKTNCAGGTCGSPGNVSGNGAGLSGGGVVPSVIHTGGAMDAGSGSGSGAAAVNMAMANVSLPVQTTQTVVSPGVYHIHTGIVELENYLSGSRVDHKKVADDSLRLHKIIYQNKINGNGGSELKMLSDRLDMLDNHNMQKIESKQLKAMDTLTIVTTVFLPLALIVGYFGMNFKFKIFSNSDAHSIIFTMFAIAVLAVIAAFKMGLLIAS